jgi:hypothetical protein
MCCTLGCCPEGNCTSLVQLSSQCLPAEKQSDYACSQVANGGMADDGGAQYDGLTIEELQQEAQNRGLETEVGQHTASC